MSTSNGLRSTIRYFAFLMVSLDNSAWGQRQASEWLVNNRAFNSVIWG
jgi:hypothetical protein